MSMTGLAVARALHVLAIVVWIGGVAMVTLVLLPAIRRGAFGPNVHEAFQAVESRFAWVARGSTIVAALTGFYMVDKLGVWNRFMSADFWWMHAMVCVWLVFTLMLFVVEPLRARRAAKKNRDVRPKATLAMLSLLHWVLLVFSIVTIAGAVLGSQGVSLADVLGIG
jgi:uncharacterized membrane protein